MNLQESIRNDLDKLNEAPIEMQTRRDVLKLYPEDFAKQHIFQDVCDSLGIDPNQEGFDGISIVYLDASPIITNYEED
jgi:hypothetical protein